MTVLAISSQVVAGHVGNSAAQPVLQMLGHEVWALPTVLLSHHPGHGTPMRRATPAADLRAMAASLEDGGWLSGLTAVSTGYFTDPDQVDAAASILTGIRHRHPDITILVDPIMGDQGSLYVAEDVAHAVARDLAPMATILTPNLFELSHLTGREDVRQLADIDAIEAAARSLGTAEVIVTSTPAAQASHIGTIAVTADGRHVTENLHVENAPNGVGDVAAASYLGHRLNGQSVQQSLEAAITMVASLIAEARVTGSRDLPLAAGRHAIIAPAR